MAENKAIKTVGEEVKKDAKVVTTVSAGAAVKEAVKPAVKEETKAAKKPAAKKTTASKKAAVKEASSVKLFVQYSGKEFSQEDIIASVQNAWTTETGKRVSAIKSLEVYLKPEESAAYYVVNGKAAGRVNL